MELDIYIPELDIGFEYQGKQHYEAIYWVSDFTAQKQRDDEKVQACKQAKFVLSILIFLDRYHVGRGTLLVELQGP